MQNGRGRRVVWGVGLLWLATLGLGLALSLAYEFTPGAPAAAPARFPGPRASREAGRPRLLLFVHPQCPCTAATLEELETFLQRNTTPLEVQAWFLLPAGKPDAWAQTARWRQAAALPGVDVRLDAGGREARRFGARTSGQVLLFAADGRLQFSGGITTARGHAGDDRAEAVLPTLLRHPAAKPVSTPVFGCALFAGES